MSKSSKSKRMSDRIQQLEKQISNEKRINAEMQNKKEVRLDDEQLDKFLEQLTERIEWSTNRIVDETRPSQTIPDTNKQDNDAISWALKLTMAVPFMLFAMLTLCALVRIWGEFWNNGWIGKCSLLVVGLIGVDCLGLGIQIFCEKDRSYIVSLFSALVALVALIVALVK